MSVGYLAEKAYKTGNPQHRKQDDKGNANQKEERTNYAKDKADELSESTAYDRNPAGKQSSSFIGAGLVVRRSFRVIFFVFVGTFFLPNASHSSLI